MHLESVKITAKKRNTKIKTNRFKYISVVWIAKMRIAIERLHSKAAIQKLQVEEKLLEIQFSIRFDSNPSRLLNSI